MPLVEAGFSRALATRRAPFLRRQALLDRHISMLRAEGEHKQVAIVGGGLAGLSVAHHLLHKSPAIQVTIFDRAPVGTGGASSVAGGLLHPFSPRGKLVHMGLEGLESANKLVTEAAKHEPECVLRNELFRLAMTEQHVKQLEQTARDFPSIAKWLNASEIKESCHAPNSLGGLKLSPPCKVLHVPSYLEGLWTSCLKKSNDTAQWLIVDEQVDWKERLQDFDVQVFCGGAGMLQSSGIFDPNSLPVQLVRGQSIEMAFSSNQQEAILCGKYVIPIDTKLVLVGATHEFGSKKLNPQEVVDELKGRCFDLCPQLWKEGRVERITSGTRVQSNRGVHGRMPIVGRAPLEQCYSNAWIFTGLSSRGLLHHGIYGDILTDAILANSEEDMLARHSHLNWWRKER